MRVLGDICARVDKRLSRYNTEDIYEIVTLSQATQYLFYTRMCFFMMLGQYKLN